MLATGQKSKRAYTHTHNGYRTRRGRMHIAYTQANYFDTWTQWQNVSNQLNRSKSQMSNQLHEYFIVHRVAHSSTLHNLLAIPALSISVSFTSIGSTEYRQRGKERERGRVILYCLIRPNHVQWLMHDRMWVLLIYSEQRLSLSRTKNQFGLCIDFWHFDQQRFGVHSTFHIPYCQLAFVSWVSNKNAREKLEGKWRRRKKNEMRLLVRRFIRETFFLCLVHLSPLLQDFFGFLFSLVVSGTATDVSSKWHWCRWKRRREANQIIGKK